MRQEELAGGEITRNLISIIENNKANLTPSTAKILVNNFNNYCLGKGIDIEVTEDYLLEDVVSQAKKVVDEYIEFVRVTPDEHIQSIYNKLNEINLFLKTYKTEEKRAELYIELGLKFKRCSHYVNAIDYFLKAFESTSDREISIKSLFYMGVCNIYASNYDEAISNFKLILDLNKESVFSYHASFNIALCYKKLGRYEEALEMLDIISIDFENNIITSIDNYIDTQMLKGACLAELNSYNKSINIYKGLLRSDGVTNITSMFSLGSLDSKKILIQIALADVYRETKDLDKLEPLCSKILNEIKSKKYDSRYDGDIALTLAKCLVVINSNKEDIISLLTSSLDSYKDGLSDMCFEEVKQLLACLLDMYIKDNNIEKIDCLKNDILELISTGSFNKYNAITLQIIKYYNENGFTQKISSLIDFIK